MSNTVERRSFLLAWLTSLLAGWFGRSQAAPTAPLPALPPIDRAEPMVFSRTDLGGSVTTYIYDASKKRCQEPILHFLKT